MSACRSNVRWKIKSWSDFIYQGESYSLAHLTSFEHEFIQQAKGDNKEVRYDFIIEFGLHCFTKGPNKNKNEALASFDQKLIYEDTREKRIFCFERHEMSKLLPEISKTVAKRKCYHTGKGNFFTIEIKGDEGNTKDYEVYFQVTKASSNKLKLYVESAYIRDPDYASSQPSKKKINFFVIAHNRQTGKAIKTSK